MSKPTYSEEQVAAAVLAVKANKGIVKPVADKMGLHSQTVQRWVSGDRRASGAAERGILVQKAERELLEGFLASAIKAQELAMAPETLAKASAYQLTIMAGINYDKYLLGTGRPTSRTEQLKARYVEPDSLQKISATVVDVPAKRLETA